MTLIYTVKALVELLQEPNTILIASVKSEKEVLAFWRSNVITFRSLFDCSLKLDLQSQFPNAFPWT